LHLPFLFYAATTGFVALEFVHCDFHVEKLTNFKVCNFLVTKLSCL